MSERRSRTAWRALEKHSQGTVWGIDSVDQWGVELGKVPGKRIAGEVMSEAEPDLAHDSSTTALIRRYRRSRNGRES